MVDSVACPDHGQLFGVVGSVGQDHHSRVDEVGDRFSVRTPHGQKLDFADLFLGQQSSAGVGGLFGSLDEDLQCRHFVAGFEHQHEGWIGFGRDQCGGQFAVGDREQFVEVQADGVLHPLELADEGRVERSEDRGDLRIVHHLTHPGGLHFGLHVPGVVDAHVG